MGEKEKMGENKGHVIERGGTRERVGERRLEKRYHVQSEFKL